MSVAKKGFILLLSGPSGAGKSSLISELEKKVDDIYFSISLTTREIRPGEKNGVDYYFVSKKEFEKDIKENMFLEWAEVHGNYYGTSLKKSMDAVKEGKIVVFDIDVQGFLQVKKRVGDLITSIFVTTPSLSELKNRLIKRKTDSNEQIEKRVDAAKIELSYAKDYDYVIINDDLKEAKAKLLCIVESARVKSGNYDIEKFTANWIES